MWPNPQFLVDLVTSNEEISNGKLLFCAVLILFSKYHESTLDRKLGSSNVRLGSSNKGSK